jgi:DNA-binding MarR family transcriptional regulator
MKHARSNSFVYLLERTLRQSRALLQQELSASGNPITVDQWLVLQQVSAANDQNLKEVSAMTAKDPATVTRIVALLEKKKLVSKRADKTDKRSIIISVTPAGKKLLQECARNVDRFRKAAGKGLTQDELNLLRGVMDKLFENCGGRLG